MTMADQGQPRRHAFEFTFPAYVTGAHDGDTLYAVIDQGFGFRNHGTKRTIDGVTLRLRGVSCIELGDPGGIETRDYVRALVTGQQVVLTTVRDDKYGGRYTAYVELHDGTDLGSHLIEHGWAVPWDGSGEPPYPAWPRPAGP